MRRELARLKKQVSSLSLKNTVDARTTGDEASSLRTLVKTMMDERQKTNELLAKISEKVVALEKEIDNLEVAAVEQVEQESQEDYVPRRSVENREVPLSALDKKILDFVQTQQGSMTCADDVRNALGYKGRNAACARLMKLYKDGLLDRVQLGHKVYYKYDAGKTTNTLIISPTQ